MSLAAGEGGVPSNFLFFFCSLFSIVFFAFCLFIFRFYLYCQSKIPYHPPLQKHSLIHYEL